MARIWQEGFEDGLPNAGYLEGNPYSQYVNDVTIAYAGSQCSLSSGRNVYSENSLRMDGSFSQNEGITKIFNSEYIESYFRIYYKNYGGTDTDEAVVQAKDISGNVLYRVAPSSAGIYSFSVRISGTLTSIGTFAMTGDQWHKVEVYFKGNSSTGAYELRVDNISIYSANSQNTGSNGIKIIFSGATSSAVMYRYIDDIAFNDTSGTINNSWCGDGTIVSLKPKSSGNKSQWDTCEGYAKGESGTSTTNIKVTGHGLATNDVIYNKSRDAYRIITYVDADNFTVSSVTGQTTNDIILLYKNVATIAATTGTGANYVVIPGHTMQSGDVIVNTSRSNAIRRVIYVNANIVVQYSSAFGGSAVTSQTSGDSIKTFAFTPYAITNHYEAVANQTDPSPKLSYVNSTTLNDIDTYDMEELTADKSIPSGASIVALSHNTYAQEAGAGSEFKPVFRISSTDYEGTTVSLSGGTLQYQQIYETSPATSSAWTRAEVDGLEAGVKLV